MIYMPPNISINIILIMLPTKTLVACSFIFHGNSLPKAQKDTDFREHSQKTFRVDRSL